MVDDRIQDFSRGKKRNSSGREGGGGDPQNGDRGEGG